MFSPNVPPHGGVPNNMFQQPPPTPAAGVGPGFTPAMGHPQFQSPGQAMQVVANQSTGNRVANNVKLELCEVEMSEEKFRTWRTTMKMWLVLSR